MGRLHAVSGSVIVCTLALAAALGPFSISRAAGGSKPSAELAGLPRATPVPRAPSSPFTEAEMDQLDAMNAKRYFHFVPCPAFANAVLVQVGLPRLGETSPVRGIRGDVDRRGEHEDLPRFTDGVTRSGTASIKYDVEGDVEAGLWELTLSRAGEGAQAEALFQFKIETRLSHPSCELLKIRYRIWDDKADVAEDAPRLERELDTRPCLPTQGPPATGLHAPVLAGVPPAVARWIQDDCALGLHYFRSAKDAVIEELQRTRAQQAH